MISELQDFVVPVTLGLVILFLAGAVHRAVIGNSVMMPRRLFFESLSVCLFGVALVLSVLCLLLWSHNPLFVLVAAAGWVVICSLFLSTIWIGQRRHQKHRVLEVPELWGTLDSAEVNLPVPTMARPVQPVQTAKRVQPVPEVPAVLKVPAVQKVPAARKAPVPAARRVPRAKEARPRLDKALRRKNLAVYRTGSRPS